MTYLAVALENEATKQSNKQFLPNTLEEPTNIYLYSSHFPNPPPDGGPSSTVLVGLRTLIHQARRVEYIALRYGHGMVALDINYYL